MIMGYRLFIVLFVCLLFLKISISSVYGNEQKAYLSKNYIDTIVQNTYYKFVEATEFKKNESQQENAIAHAKDVVTILKRNAVNDPNRHYILWKAKELEYQIHLEEEELTLKKEYKKQKAINVLVGQFNTEIGKWRPDFINLIAIHSSMYDLNGKKANELAYLIENRSRNISREVSYSLEKALFVEGYEKAAKEFEYIRDNRKFLTIPDKKYSNFERRFRAKEEADDIVSNIKTYIKEIKVIVHKNNIAEAKRNIEFFRNRIKDASALFPPGKRNGLNYQIGQLSGLVAHKEDSLVKENMKLVEQGNINGALDYMNKVLVKRGVSQKNISMIDNAIIGKIGRYDTGVDESVNKELNDFENMSSQNNGLGFTDVQARMQQKRDSIMAYKQEQARLAQIEYERTHKKEIAAKKRLEKERQKNMDKARLYSEKIYLLLEENKEKKALSKFKKYKKPLQKHLIKEVFLCLEDAVLQANKPKIKIRAEDAQEKEKAKQAAREIYSLLEKDNAQKAYNKFIDMRSLLKKNSLNQDFTNLESTVLRAYNYSKNKKQEELAAVEIKTETPANNKPVNSNENLNAYQEFDNVKLEAKDKAAQDVETIYIFLEEDNIQQAYEYFKKNQILIQKYVIKEVYDVLESTVMSAYK